MKPNHILLAGSFLVIVAILLWYFDIISEPLAALAGALLTLVAYFLALKQNKSVENVPKKTSYTIKQENTGKGDNIGKDKIEMSKGAQVPSLPKTTTTPNKTTVIQKNTGDGDNVGGNKIVIK